MHPIRAVLDTNVIVSAHLRPDGRQALILELGIAGAFRICASDSLLEECSGVLQRPRFGFDARVVRRSIETIRRASILVTPRRKLQVTHDPDDNMVLECALEADANYLVTGNLRHFPARFRGIRIISPREFVTLLAAGIE